MPYHPPPPHTTRSRGYLPHWERPHATYAVTFRLHDSLPQSVLHSYLRERDDILTRAQQQNRELTTHEQDRLADLFSERIEKALDQGLGACYLKTPEVAQLVLTSLQHFHPTRYTLHAACIMPNHVHLLLQPHAPHTLRAIMHSLKSYTATQANKFLARKGDFWMPEYYDHLIRDPADHRHAADYILRNPSQANLDNWPWLYPPPPGA